MVLFRLMTDLTLETLRAELAPVSAQLAALEANVSSLDAKVSGLDTKVSGLDAKVSGLDAKVSGLDAKVSGLDTKVSGLDAKVSSLDTKISTLDGKVAPMRAPLDGLPLINRSLTVLQQETRALRAAFNDFARTSVTAGKIEALHADVNRVQAENTDLQTRLATVERLLTELQRQRP